LDADIVLSDNIPQGAGLSSSALCEVTVVSDELKSTPYQSAASGS